MTQDKLTYEDFEWLCKAKRGVEDDSRPALQSLHVVELAEGKYVVVGMDGFRLHGVKVGLDVHLPFVIKEPLSEKTAGHVRGYLMSENDGQWFELDRAAMYATLQDWCEEGYSEVWLVWLDRAMYFLSLGGWQRSLRFMGFTVDPEKEGAAPEPIKLHTRFLRDALANDQFDKTLIGIIDLEMDKDWLHDEKRIAYVRDEMRGRWSVVLPARRDFGSKKDPTNDALKEVCRALDALEDTI